MQTFSAESRDRESEREREKESSNDGSHVEASWKVASLEKSDAGLRPGVEVPPPRDAYLLMRASSDIENGKHCRKVPEDFAS